MAYTTVNDPSANFQIALYTGNAGTQNITNDGNANLKPDLISIRNRDYSNSGAWIDSTRGNTKWLETPANANEQTFANNNFGFLTDGFSVDYNGGYNNLNKNSDGYVAWQWKANGGTTATNSSGTITSTVQANTTAGFSIVSYTGNNTSGATVGHGLGAAPDTIILKALTDSQNWFVNTPVGGGVGYMMLNQTDADSGSNVSVWNSTAPTSTVFTLGNSGGVNDSISYVAYCFKSIQGYSKMGNYTGNGADDGPFVYTGFKPAFLMAKKTSGTGTWFMWDNKRTPFNVINIRMLANTSAGDDTSNDNRIDFLSNGFKIRDNSTSFNDNNSSMFYMAFAENPLVATNDVVGLAR